MYCLVVFLVFKGFCKLKEQCLGVWERFGPNAEIRPSVFSRDRESDENIWPAGPFTIVFHNRLLVLLFFVFYLKIFVVRETFLWGGGGKQKSFFGGGILMPELCYDITIFVAIFGLIMDSREFKFCIRCDNENPQTFPSHFTPVKCKIKAVKQQKKVTCDINFIILGNFRC